VSGYFLTKRGELRRAGDTETANRTQLDARRMQHFGTRTEGVSNLFVILGSGPEPMSLQLGDGDEQSRRTNLGNLLFDKRGHVIGAYQITEAGTRQVGVPLDREPVCWGECAEGSLGSLLGCVCLSGEKE